MSVDFMDAMKSLDEIISPDKELEYIETLPTNIRDLDVILGGGIPIGKIIEIYGVPDSGKSATAYNILKSTVDRGGYAILLDSEDRYSPDWWSNWGLRPEKTLLKELDVGLVGALADKKETKVSDLPEIEQVFIEGGYSFTSNHTVKQNGENKWIIKDNTSKDTVYSLVLDAEYLRLFLLPNLRYYFTHLLEDAISSIDKLINWGVDTIREDLVTIVLDSYDGLPAEVDSKSEVEDYFKGKKIGGKATLFGEFISRWTGKLSGYKYKTGVNPKVTLVVLNHAKTDFKYGAYYSTGGSKFKHFQYTRILLTSGGDVEPTKAHGGGFVVKAKVERNKASSLKDGLKAEFRFLQPNKEAGNPAQFAVSNTKDAKAARAKVSGNNLEDVTTDNNETGSDVGEEE